MHSPGGSCNNLSPPLTAVAPENGLMSSDVDLTPVPGSTGPPQAASQATSALAQVFEEAFQTPANLTSTATLDKSPLLSKSMQYDEELKFESKGPTIGPPPSAIATALPTSPAIDAQTGTAVHQLHNGWTPLCTAAFEGNIDNVRTLLNSGADPNIPNAQGVSPLFYAAMNWNTPMVQLLRKCGASVRKSHGPDGQHIVKYVHQRAGPPSEKRALLLALGNSLGLQKAKDDASSAGALSQPGESPAARKGRLRDLDKRLKLVSQGLRETTSEDTHDNSIAVSLIDEGECVEIGKGQPGPPKKPEMQAPRKKRWHSEASSREPSKMLKKSHNRVFTGVVAEIDLTESETTSENPNKSSKVQDTQAAGGADDTGVPQPMTPPDPEGPITPPFDDDYSSADCKGTDEMQEQAESAVVADPYL